MTLQEAIDHLKADLQDDSHDCGCQECKDEHEQLLHWLEELQLLRQQKDSDAKESAYHELAEMCKQVEATNAEVRNFIADYRRRNFRN